MPHKYGKMGYGKGKMGKKTKKGGALNTGSSKELSYDKFAKAMEKQRYKGK